MIEVLEPGALTTVQDLGRFGSQADGFSPCGAMDSAALRVANLLVGNAEGEAALEITLTGPTLRFHSDALIAIAGADFGGDVPPWRPAFVRAGTTLRLDVARAGCRAYLAVAGGFDLPETLGSRSTDLRAGIGGFGGRALQTGDRIALRHPAPAEAPPVETWSVSWRGFPPWLYRSALIVRVTAGPELERFTEAARERFFGSAFHVSAQSDRMGCRLTGAKLQLHEPLELLSEGVATGTVQVPPGGEPIVLMADRQTTGGYPRIAQVISVDLPIVAQMPPGAPLRFELLSLEIAQALFRERETAFARLRAGLKLHAIRR